MNNVMFTEQKIWRKDFDNGSAYSISVSTRDEDGKFINAYMNVKFAKSAEAPAKIHNGAVADFSGFLTATRKGQPMIMVTKLNIKDDEYPAADDIDIDSFEQAIEDIPF